MRTVLVKWRDSVVYSQWCPIEDTDIAHPKVCQAKGDLIRDDEDVVIVGLLVDEDEKTVSNYVVIPAESVIHKEFIGGQSEYSPRP